MLCLTGIDISAIVFLASSRSTRDRERDFRHDLHFSRTSFDEADEPG